jgi:hypothetical protein
MLFLALCMGRSIFLEGEEGVGESEIANCSATRYEGLDVAGAVYAWNYAAQMAAIRLADTEGDADRERLSHDAVSENFLIRRPRLRALEPDTAGAAVVLIDEFDRTDEAFEPYLLEVLANYPVTIGGSAPSMRGDRQLSSQRREYVSGVADGTPAAQNITSLFMRPRPFRPQAPGDAAIGNVEITSYLSSRTSGISELACTSNSALINFSRERTASSSPCAASGSP